MRWIENNDLLKFRLWQKSISLNNEDMNGYSINIYQSHFGLGHHKHSPLGHTNKIILHSKHHRTIISEQIKQLCWSGQTIYGRLITTRITTVRVASSQIGMHWAYVIIAKQVSLYLHAALDTSSSNFSLQNCISFIRLQHSLLIFTVPIIV